MKRLIHKILRWFVIKGIRKRYTAIIIETIKTDKYDVDESLFLAEQVMKFLYPKYIEERSNDDERRRKEDSH